MIPGEFKALAFFFFTIAMLLAFAKYFYQIQMEMRVFGFKEICVLGIMFLFVSIMLGISLALILEKFRGK